MKKINLYITLKQGVLDPQGKAVQESLHTLGYTAVKQARVGKYMELIVEDDANVEQQIEEMCTKLLANPVIEDYTYIVEEGIVQ
ncbi:phosphoribosylformylglycinamidine synthase subunit PurS [Aquibacillus sp. 3ASR75-11]|uniref:Phosphoribosylformylglycinamidine synthase subunit PurS n=1 Tax=Terrihalobacillus insolitus TaxID=2950438 RepID=A0A9X4AMG6_9BACI|nr:phosphoribosylformylglycinamidine synthase subunit PurS [Terrihalobacillus insolitus]MDC3414201.1 phosphoribosylformylglycinamidine synthase subunit PurS [Terrihalobacillus insolitus]MDC3425407.1 phosphoribosylformylglycinamidine synthase subunit PurS [Terrihalobacillus insolitus]